MAHVAVIKPGASGEEGVGCAQAGSLRALLHSAVNALGSV